MSLEKALNAFFKILNPLTRAIFYISITCLAIMMFLTAIDVMGRYFFNSPIIGAFEITEYLMVLLMAGAFAYTGITEGHVVVELVTDRLPKRTQAILLCITSFLSMALLTFITWQGFIYIGDNISSKVSSATLQIPSWPFVLILAIGFTIFLLVLVFQFLQNIHKAVCR